jgi:hypothetical protein
MWASVARSSAPRGEIDDKKRPPGQTRAARQPPRRMGIMEHQWMMMLSADWSPSGGIHVALAKARWIPRLPVDAREPQHFEDRSILTM